MSRFSSIFTAAARPTLFAVHGETVTRYPLGVVADAVSVTAMFDEMSPDLVKQRGEDNMRRGTLSMASSVTVDSRDTWLINSEVWGAASEGSTSAGMRVVEVQIVERKRTRPVRAG